MIRAGDAHARKSGRWWRVLVVVAVLAATAWGASELYRFRSAQNTRKLLAQAQKASDSHNWDEASTAYRQYLQRQPDDLDALGAYTDVLIAQMKTTPTVAGEAVRALRRLVGMEPENVDAAEKLTGLYLGLREFGLAEELASTWQRLDPESRDANLALAVALHRLKKSRQAADTLITAISREPGETEYYPLLINLLAGELKQPDEAARWLAEALRIGGDSPGVQLAAFLFYRGQNDVARAEVYLERALELAPESLEALLPAGLFCLSHGRLDDARALLDRASRLAPDDLAVLAARASWATQANDTDSLIAIAGRFLELAENGDTGLLTDAAELYFRAGSFDQVEKCLVAVDTLPRATDALTARLALLRGAMALHFDKPFQAINQLHSALKLDPANRRARRMLGVAYATAGDLEAAADTYQRLIIEAPADADARLHAAELAWQRNRPGEARDVVAAMADPGNPSEQVAKLVNLACDLREKTRGSDIPKDDTELQDRLDELASGNPDHAIAARWLMRCLVLAGKPTDAVKLVSGYQDDPRFGPDLGLELGQLLFAGEFAELGAELAEDLVRWFPNAPEPPALRAQALLATGSCSDAIAYANDELPSAAQQRVWETVADGCVDAGQIDNGLALYRRIAERFPDDIPSRRKLMRYTMALDEAIQRNGEIRAIEGDDGLHWRFELANTLLRLGSSASAHSQAREHLEHCLAERPRWLTARLLLGYAQELKSDLPEAVESYEIAITQEPRLRTQPAAIRLIGLLYRLGRLTQADALLDSLARLSPKDPSILRLRAEQQMRKRDFDSAITIAERLLALQPDDPAWTLITADLHLRVGNPDRAEAIAQDALARGPSSPPLLWALARAQIAQGRSEEAEQHIRHAVADANDAPHHVLLARVLALLHKRTDAEQAIDKAQSAAPEDASVWAACADFWGSLNDRARQVACTRKAIAIRGEDPARSLLLARLLGPSTNPSDRAEAREIVGKCLDDDPEDFSALVLGAELALATEPPDFARAEADLKRALSIDPRSAEAYRLLAGTKFRSGQLEAAGEAVATGLAFIPDDPDLLLIAAELYCFHGEYLKAITPLRRLVEVQPRHPQAVRLLATAYSEVGRLGDAMAFIEALAPPEALTATELLVQARLTELTGDLERAEALYSRALTLTDTSPPALLALAQFHARNESYVRVHDLGLRRRAEAPDDVASLAVVAELLGAQSSDEELRQTGMTWLEQIARENPDNASDARYRLGMCHYRIRNLAKAEEQFTQAAERSPLAPRPVNALAWMYAEDLGRPDDARAVIDRFLAAGGEEDAPLLDTHATVLLRLRELPAAIQKLTECIKIAGQTPTLAAAHYHLGLVYLEQENLPTAVSYIKTALRLAERVGGLTAKETEKAKELVEQEASAHSVLGP